MYQYESEKQRIFTDEGQRAFLKVRDKVQSHLKQSGAFTLGSVMVAGDTWRDDYIATINDDGKRKTPRTARWLDGPRGRVIGNAVSVPALLRDAYRRNKNIIERK